MKFNCIIIRFSELVLKSDPVRRRFQKILVRNIKNALEKKKIENKIFSRRFNLILETENIRKASAILKKIFGVISISPALSMELAEMNDFFENNSEKIVKKTFAVRVSREGKHDFSSRDVERRIGSIIVNKTKKRVNLSQPEQTIYIDIRNDDAYVYSEKMRCVGGLPLGTAGRVVCYIEKKEDVVATWLMMKRGCIPVLCYKKLANVLDKWSFGIKLEKIKISNVNKMKKISEKYNVRVLVFGDMLKNNVKEIKHKIKKFENVFFPCVGFGQAEIEKRYRQIIKNN